MDLFDVLVARKYSDGGGGGGGSSDASIAHITLVDEGVVGAELLGAFATDSMDSYSVPTCYTDDMSVDVLLYKGKAFIDATDVINNSHATISVSGSAIYDINYPTSIYVTGDCTITVS